jgi:hypothetical protein
MYVRVHQPLRRLPDGRPALLATVVDHQAAERLTRGGQLAVPQALQDFQRLVVNYSVRWRCCWATERLLGSLALGLAGSWAGCGPLTL